MEDKDSESEQISRLINFKKEQFQNQARKQYRDHIFRKKRLQETLIDHGRTEIKQQKQDISLICLKIDQMKSQDIELVRSAIEYFRDILQQNQSRGQTELLDENQQEQDEQYTQDDIIRKLVDQNIVYEIIELFNSTISPTNGEYRLPHDVAANALYVLAIIASSDESFINSILNKNGLTLFKNYAFLPIQNEPYLLSSAFLGIVNLSSLERKNVRQHLKSIGMLEHLQVILSESMHLIEKEEWKQMIENGVWLTSVLAYDPPETEAELTQLNNTIPFFVSCLNSSNIKIVKDVIWIIDICLTQIPQKFPGAEVAQKLISLGICETFNRTVQLDNIKIKTQTLRGINKLMKLSPPNQIDKIYSPIQVQNLLPVLKSKINNNQYYAVNYINELCYQNRFRDFLEIPNVLAQLIFIVETRSNDKNTQLVLQSVLKMLELGTDQDIKRIFESGLLSILQNSLVYSDDGEKSAPQNIMLSLQILELGYRLAEETPQYYQILQNLYLEGALFNLQTHPMEKIYYLNLEIVEKYYEEA